MTAAAKTPARNSGVCFRDQARLPYSLQGRHGRADVVRIDKGHTEGLEPKVTEAAHEADALGEGKPASKGKLKASRVTHAMFALPVPTLRRFFEGP